MKFVTMSIFCLIKTRKIVENYLINKHGGNNHKLLNIHSGKYVIIMEHKSIFINKHVLLLDR